MTETIKEKYEELKLLNLQIESVRKEYWYSTIPNSEQDLLDKKYKEITFLSEKSEKLEDEICKILLHQFYPLDLETVLIVHDDEYYHLEEVKLFKEE